MLGSERVRMRGCTVSDGREDYRSGTQDTRDPVVTLGGQTVFGLLYVWRFNSQATASSSHS